MEKKNKLKVEELAEKMENHDTLITYGEEALTMRKDDPRTQEYKNKVVEEMVEKIKKDGETDLWAGLSLSNARIEGESYEDYRDRLVTIKNLEKIYKRLGRDECKRQYPNGFAYALHKAMEEGIGKVKEKDPQFTATIDGREVPVIINNEKK